MSHLQFGYVLPPVVFLPPFLGAKRALVGRSLPSLICLLWVLVFLTLMCYNQRMLKSSPLSFRVQCSACYGIEVWRLERITRVLNEAGKLPPPPHESEIELIAQEFILYSKKLHCPGCGKVGAITVQRVVPEEG
jgi:hypothetical protein